MRSTARLTYVDVQAARDAGQALAIPRERLDALYAAFAALGITRGNRVGRYDPQRGGEILGVLLAAEHLLEEPAVFQQLRHPDRAFAARLAHRFFERGLARLEGHWAGTGDAGESYVDPAHPYAQDLDLFGKGSLTQVPVAFCRIVYGL